MPHESTEGIIDAPPPPSKRSKRPKVKEQWAAVGNASDPEQVKEAERDQRDKENQWLMALAVAPEIPDMQILLLRIMEKCGIFLSVWHDNPARMAYNSGQQDLGHWLMVECEKIPGLMAKIMAHRKE